MHQSGATLAHDTSVQGIGIVGISQFTVGEAEACGTDVRRKWTGDLSAVLSEHFSDRLDSEPVPVLAHTGDYRPSLLIVHPPPRKSRGGPQDFFSPLQFPHLVTQSGELRGPRW